MISRNSLTYVTRSPFLSMRNIIFYVIGETFDFAFDHIYTAIYEYTKQLSNMKTFNHNGRDS